MSDPKKTTGSPLMDAIAECEQAEDAYFNAAMRAHARVACCNLLKGSPVIVHFKCKDDNHAHAE
jgi:hypothetical protein